ncbi:VanZ family protein [Mycobacterium sp. Y57]|uniref:VanZ family protein n=1 Tax=Mycolicibacterium xanthum TaxID=2796469 RepID=UPI001C8414AB|nr:VanZ family protein [Mycolicibacterium xanthum]MBX7432035.1 VanZ family protein [Mycolicibacterium xanthum]
MPRRTLAGVLWFALTCWAGGILWLSSLTPKELPELAFLVSDKINHVIAFAVGGWLAASALLVSRPLAAIVGGIVLAVIIIAAFGALDESLQTFTPGRTGGDIYDWIADVLGALIGALLSLATHRRLDRLLPSP